MCLIYPYISSTDQLKVISTLSLGIMYWNYKMGALKIFGSFRKLRNKTREQYKQTNSPVTILISFVLFFF